MAETVLPYALTTLARVKARLDMNPDTPAPIFDTLLTRMINEATDWIERETGGRRFLMTLYTNEIYSAAGSSQKRMTFRQGPVFFLTTYGAITAGSTSITGVANTAGIVVGMPIQGDNLQAQTTVSAVSGDTVTLSLAASTTASQGYFQVNGLINIQWRTGTPSTPTWTSYIPDQYELRNGGRSGIARLYGVFPRIMDNMVRATYYAGYLINWSNAGDGITHTLPSDLTGVCENLVVRRFKRRQFAGKTSEALQGAATTWSREIDMDDKAVIGHYQRAPGVF
jgi:hypothetical protein